MANQMIALGIKGAQLPDLGAVASRMGNVMANMATAREKQASTERARAFRELVSSPDFDPMNPEDIKAAQALDPAGAERLVAAGTSRRKADLEYIGELTKQYRDKLAMIGPDDKQGYAMLRDEAVAAIPGWASRLPSPEQWNRDTRVRVLMQAENVINKTIPTPTATYQMGEKGVPYVARVGGLGPQGMFELETYEPDQTSGGTGGPMEPVAANAPQMMPGTIKADQQRLFASAITRATNPQEYDHQLKLAERISPELVAQFRQFMPRFDAQVMDQLRQATLAEYGPPEYETPPAQPGGLVTGDRGGMGGPYEPASGFVVSSNKFRGRVPPPPQGPQPRETAEEAAAKRRAVLNVEREFELNRPQPKPTPLTEAQRLARRDALAGEYKKVTALIDKTYAPKAGIISAVNAVRNLSRDQKEAVTGYSAYAPSVFKSSKDADTAIKNLKGTVTELGKEAAAATGAIGSMAVQEWTIVANMIANLDLEGMSAEGLDEQLNIIEAKAKNAARLTKQAYDAQYSRDVSTMPEFRINMPAAATRAAPKPGSQYPVMTPEQVRKAPKGTKFRRADNGKPMVKQ